MTKASTRSEIHLDAYQLGQISDGARLSSGEGVTFTGATCDTRLLRPGQLFVALPGLQTDGHHYLPEASTRGAAAALVQRDHPALRESPGELPRIEVRDVLTALHNLARWRRDQFVIPFVAVTGSNGKTTTKEMIAAVLASRYRVFRTPGNYNSGIGVPLALLDLEPGTEVAVCEFGMSARGEIDTLARLVRPQFAVLTNIAPAHLETLGTVDDVAAAKFELLAHLPADGLAFFCADDPRLREAAQRFGPRARTYGLAPDADLAAFDVHSADAGVRFGLEGGEEVILPLFGLHNVANALAALSVARAMQVDTIAAVAALAVIPPAEHRSRVRRAGTLTLIDDVYNANPNAMQAALQSLCDFSAPGRRVAVLGDMLELGPEAPRWHRELGDEAARQGLDLLVAVGPQAAATAAAARTAGMAADDVLHYDRSEDCAADVRRWVRRDDTVLLKGSRGIALEIVLAALEAYGNSRSKEE